MAIADRSTGKDEICRGNLASDALTPVANLLTVLYIGSFAGDFIE
ncbi:MAG: hypothetical protein ABL967_03230 [Bryobacteraceae bacterium]